MKFYFIPPTYEQYLPLPQDFKIRNLKLLNQTLCMGLNHFILISHFTICRTKHKGVHNYKLYVYQIYKILYDCTKKSQPQLIFLKLEKINLFEISTLQKMITTL